MYMIMGQALSPGGILEEWKESFLTGSTGFSGLLFLKF
jgi:hypothetical protein